MNNETHGLPVSKEGHPPSAQTYLLVGLALWALTALTWWLSTVSLGVLQLPIALLIASIKAVIVALFFMHLWGSTGTVPLTLAIAIGFVLVLVAFTLTDLTRRFEPARPKDSPFDPGSRRIMPTDSAR